MKNSASTMQNHLESLGFSEQTNMILRLISSILNPSSSTASTLPNLSHQYKVIRAMVEVRSPIVMVLPAFPAKSANDQKTFGPMPDLGELLALKKLNRTCEAIRRIYSPGAAVIICSDGRVFNDLVQVSDANVNKYQTAIQEMIEKFGLQNLSTFNLDDYFEGLDFDAMRQKLSEDFAEPLSELQERVKTDISARFLFNGIHRFMTEDLSVIKKHLSKNAVRKIAKKMTYEVIQRSNAWGRLLEGQFPLALRLSIHPQVERSSKMAVQLLPSTSQWRTPWHSVVLTDGHSQILVRRDEAEALNAEVRFFAKEYPYFFVPSLSANNTQKETAL